MVLAWTRINDADLTFNGSAETDGTFTITTAGGGANVITLGEGNDTYTGSDQAVILSLLQLVTTPLLQVPVTTPLQQAVAQTL